MFYATCCRHTFLRCQGVYAAICFPVVLRVGFYWALILFKFSMPFILPFVLDLFLCACFHDTIFALGRCVGRLRRVFMYYWVGLLDSSVFLLGVLSYIFSIMSKKKEMMYGFSSLILPLIFAPPLAFTFHHIHSNFCCFGVVCACSIWPFWPWFTMQVLG